MEKAIFAIVCAAVVIAGVYFGFSKFFTDNQPEVDRLEHIAESLKEEFVPLKFKVDYKKNGTAEINIKYFTQDGKQASKISYIVEGSEIFFDFKIINIESKNLFFFFPYSVYTNKIEPQNGIHIYDDYSNEGVPLIYKSKTLDNPDDIQFLKELLAYAKTGTGLEADASYGYSLHDLNDFNMHFMPDTTYKVVCHKQKGGIEFQED